MYREFLEVMISDRAILIVEDEISDRELIIEAFRANGVTTPIHVVNNGKEAIAYLMGEGEYADRKKFPYPSLLITDLKMPGLDGFGVLEHLKNNPEWGIVPTVVLTASTDADDVKKAYMLGASCYHQKRQSMGQLRRLLGLLHDYWMTCVVPEVDATGKRLPTESRGKLGERFAQSSGSEQKRKSPPGH